MAVYLVWDTHVFLPILSDQSAGEQKEVGNKFLL